MHIHNISAGRTVSVLLSLTIALCINVSEIRASEPVKRLLLQSQLPASAPQTKYAKQFAQELARRTGGRMEITVAGAPAGTAWPRNIIPLLGERKADLVLTYVNTLNFREGQIGMLPGLVNNREQSAHFSKTLLAQTLTSQFENAQGGKNLIWLWEKSVIVSKSAPVRIPEDARAIRTIRAVGAYIDLFRELGVTAFALPLSEIWTAMDRGLLVAAVVPVWLIADASEASRAADVVAVPDGDSGFYSLMSIAISPKSYSELPPDLQRLIVTTAADAEQAAPDFMARQDTVAVASFSFQGKSVIAVGAEEFSAWANLARDKVWMPYFSRIKLDDNLTGLLRGFR